MQILILISSMATVPPKRAHRLISIREANARSDNMVFLVILEARCLGTDADSIIGRRLRRTYITEHGNRTPHMSLPSWCFADDSADNRTVPLDSELHPALIEPR